MAPIFRTAGPSGANEAERAISKRPALTRLFGALTMIAVGGLFSIPARAQNAYCDNLRAQIAAAGTNPAAARYHAAAVKQQNEINRTAAYGRSLGCDRQQFLFFGNPPPRQCGPVNAKLAQMQANLAALQRVAAGGEGQRHALLARYDAQCRQRVAARPRNIFEELFGAVQEEDPNPLRDMPITRPAEDEGAHGLGGSMAICVRACDGGFFPISYSARRANLEELSELCRAQCPNAEVTLYTRSPWRDVETALSIDGQPYSDHPNAMKFAKTFDPSCACKPPGKSWVETLAEAERILAEKHSDDVVVSAERAEELSRPVVARGRKAVSAPQEPAPAAAPASEGAKGAARGHEATREVVGPDGVKRRVRVVAPTM